MLMQQWSCFIGLKRHEYKNPKTIPPINQNPNSQQALERASHYAVHCVHTSDLLSF